MTTIQLEKMSEHVGTEMLGLDLNNLTQVWFAMVQDRTNRREQLFSGEWQIPGNCRSPQGGDAIGEYRRRLAH